MATTRRGVPDPCITLPIFAVPTVVVFLGSATAWGAATTVVLSDASRWFLIMTIPTQAFVMFAMFNVFHESAHHAVSQVPRVNQFFGHASIPFVSVIGTFPVLRYIHLEHHRHTNEDTGSDPDAWAATAPRWLLPARWSVIDAHYALFYLSRMRSRPRGEVMGGVASAVAGMALMAIVMASGHLPELILIYLIPQRIALVALAALLDWLPHHDLEGTATTDRFHAARVRVGWERIMNPLLFWQNYHLVHHIHPAIPFYLLVRAWKNTEADYLDRNVPISTAWGRQLTRSQYRAWRRTTSSYGAADAVEQRDWPRCNRFHSLRVAETRRLTANSVSIIFDVPAELTDLYQFEPGQSLAIRAFIGEREVRRNYSIYTAAGSGLLGIAVKWLAGGTFSRYANTMLRAGDELDVMPPSGLFTLTPAPARGRTIGAIAGGSGITPIISILASALAAEPETSATLLYANRDSASVMFGSELTKLARRFEGRLRITHYLSRGARTDFTVESKASEVAYERVQAGRLTASRLATLLDSLSGQYAVDEWYICGPEGLARTATHALSARHTPAHRIHRELFVSTNRALRAPNVQVVPASVTVTMNRSTTETTVAGDESLLDAALRAGVDAPYSCSGGACGTCKARLLRGTAHMEQNHALNDDDLANGWILTCQSRPTARLLHVAYGP
ncbi:MAG TPA: fatty acid desaturase [Mycobacterium sp.]|nr:fatty acid desaturase [Mycobacterium sp.]